MAVKTPYTETVPNVRENVSHLLYSDLIEDPAARYSLVAFTIMGILVATVGNTMVMFFIARRRSVLKSNTVFLVFNLAFCDFLMGSLYQGMRLVDVILPFSQEHRSKVLTNSYCQVTGFFSMLLGSVAFLTIVTISQERMLLICYPFRAKTLLTVRRTKILLATIWAISIAVMLPIPIMYSFVANVSMEQTHVNVTVCVTVILDHYGQPGSKGYCIFIFMTYFVIPVIVISASYTKIFYTLRKSSFEKDMNDALQKQLQKRKRLAQMMLSIAVLFVLCWGPYFFFFIFLCSGGKMHSNGLFILLMIEMLPLISSSINPFIYTFHSDSFRKGLLSFLRSPASESEYNNSRRDTFKSDYRTEIKNDTVITPKLAHKMNSRPTTPKVKSKIEGRPSTPIMKRRNDDSPLQTPKLALKTDSTNPGTHRVKNMATATPHWIISNEHAKDLGDVEL